jgi:hypothetical protein
MGHLLSSCTASGANWIVRSPVFESGKRSTADLRSTSVHLSVRISAGRHPVSSNRYHLAERHIVKALGSLPVDQVEPEHVEQLRHRLRHTPYMANRTIAALSSFMTWAERHGYRRRGQNPCRGIEKYAEHGHKRYLTPDEYARLGQAIRDAAKTGAISPSALMAINEARKRARIDIGHALKGDDPQAARSAFLFQERRDVNTARASRGYPDRQERCACHPTNNQREDWSLQSLNAEEKALYLPRADERGRKAT